MAYQLPYEKDMVAVPMMEIWLDEKEIPKSYYRLVEEVQYESHTTGSDLGIIYMADPNLDIIDDPFITRGKKVRLYGGWKGNLSKWIVGYVAMIEIDFPNSGKPTITITCMDESYLLDRFDVKRSFSDITFSELVGVIAPIYGFHTKGSPTMRVHESITQTNETDITLLVRIAEQEGLIVKVKDGTIIWEEIETIIQKTPEPTRVFHWRTPPFNLQFFRPRVVLADRKDEIKESEIDTDTGEILEGTVDSGEKMGEDGMLFDGFHHDGETGKWIYMGD